MRVRLSHRDETFGVISLDGAPEHGDADRRVATAVADMAALAIANMRARDNVQALGVRLKTQAVHRRSDGDEDRQHSAFLKTVIDSLNHPFYAIDVRDYTITMVNEAGRQLGIEEGRYCYAATHQRTSPCEGEDHVCPLKVAVETGGSVTAEHTHYDAQGRRRYYEVHGHPILDDDGRPTQLIEYALDVTDRKQLEADLRDYREHLEELVAARTLELSDTNARLQAETDQRERAQEETERLATAVEQASESVVITDPDGIIIYVNEAFVTTSGYARDEAIGQKPSILKSGRHEDAYYRELWQTVKVGHVWRGRLVNRKKDGSLWEEEASITPLRDGPEGPITHFVAVKRDITHEAELEAQLRQSQKMEAIGTLAGGIAHDFNNILSAILGYAEIARELVEEDSEADECIAEVILAGNRAANLVRQILTFSRQTEKEDRPILLAPIVKEALKFLRGSLPATIEIHQDIYEECPAICADPTQVHQVLMNICTNAYHAMEEESGTLSVTLKHVKIGQEHMAACPDLAPGLFAKLTIGDTGKGMDEATRQRIFEPYFTTKAEGKGTGLGLAIVHGIVKDCGGVITVSSKPGQGTTFEIYYPLLKGEKQSEPEVVSIPPRGHGEHVLLVDDEAPVLAVTELFLTRLGYDVSSFSNPREALHDFKSTPEAYDVAITDNTMPKMTGIALSRELVAIRPDMPVILTTGLDGDSLDSEAKQAGVGQVIAKPINRSALAHGIQEALLSCAQHEPTQAVV